MPLHTIGSPGLWIGFVLIVLLILAFDLGVFHRKAHVVGYKEALGWSVVWIAVSLLFGGWVWMEFGREAGVEFLAGYVLEKSLSVDNIFVFIVIFSALGIPRVYQHRVLFLGIMGALLLRATMILAGAAMLERFHWLMYVFGLFLIYTGVKVFFGGDDDDDPREGWVMRTAQRVMRTTTNLHGERFFAVENGKLHATPLFMALVLVEISDVIFAVDSIPAIFAITRDPFIVFSSNICAILGLRSLFFLLAEAVDKFRYLSVGLAFVLAFVGVKMVLSVEVFKIPAEISLVVILAILGASIAASIVAERRERRAE
ncbi:MAG: TerC family protein [Myxococcales bacterium]|jgi:tellurite resistance protein TerC|nr:TerC family protein [Myxococcales bacterium]